MPDRDRLRELLDAVLADDNRDLERMAADTYTSRFHFSRLLSRDTGEAPMAMRRRVMLERAAWQLHEGSQVTDAAWAAGYGSVEGFSRAFSRAFGHPPSEPSTGHWLPAPNGIHFHPPTSLWVRAEEQAMNPLTEQLISHDLGDSRHLLEIAKGLTDQEFRTVRVPGMQVLEWDGPEESIQQVLHRLVFSKEIWLASIDGAPEPGPDRDGDAISLLERHDAVAPRWLAMVRELNARGGWDDRLIDALCDPPESFVMSSVVAHVLTYSAHRRQLLRHYLRNAGKPIDSGDPIMWLRATRGEITEES